MRILHVTDDLAETSGVVAFLKGLMTSLATHGTTGEIMVAADRALPVGDYDIVHLHGLWLPIYHRIFRWAKGNGLPVVWSPHGMLTPWALHNHWWKKWPYWHLIQKWDMRGADVLHVTAASEEEDVRRVGLTNPAAIIPLGVEVPRWRGETESVDKGPVRTILFVSRIQKKKGLPLLLAAWSKLSAEKLSDEWRLVIAGPDEEGHLAELKALAGKLHLPHVEFIGPVFGAAKDSLYRQSDIFVLPTRSENFGSVVIEALAHGTPVVCTKGAPWSELETYHCGKWCDIDAGSIAAALREMMALSDDERNEMGRRGRTLVQENYTWEAVGREMNRVYEGLLK